MIGTMQKPSIAMQQDSEGVNHGSRRADKTIKKNAPSKSADVGRKDRSKRKEDRPLGE